MIQVAPGISFDEALVQFRAMPASGPGGQNVNKVATAVELRLEVTAVPALSSLLPRLRRVAGSRLTADGTLIVHSQRFRTQERNRQDAMLRLVHLLVQAAHPPRPRRPTGPTAASQQRRLRVKAHRGEVKRERRPLVGEEQ